MCSSGSCCVRFLFVLADLFLAADVPSSSHLIMARVCLDVVATLWGRICSDPTAAGLIFLVGIKESWVMQEWNLQRMESVKADGMFWRCNGSPRLWSLTLEIVQLNKRLCPHLRGCCEGSRGQDFVSWAVLERLRCLEYLRGPGARISCLGQCWGAWDF